MMTRGGSGDPALGGWWLPIALVVGSFFVLAFIFTGFGVGAYLGTLMGESIPYFTSPVAGHPPVHWQRDISGFVSPPSRPTP